MGKKDLGVDISGAGSSATDHQKFVEAPPSDAQVKVKGLRSGGQRI
jgi:hypothetical protein